MNIWVRTYFLGQVLGPLLIINNKFLGWWSNFATLTHSPAACTAEPVFIAISALPALRSHITHGWLVGWICARTAAKKGEKRSKWPFRNEGIDLLILWTGGQKQWRGHACMCVRLCLVVPTTQFKYVVLDGRSACLAYLACLFSCSHRISAVQLG